MATLNTSLAPTMTSIRMDWTALEAPVLAHHPLCRAHDEQTQDRRERSLCGRWHCFVRAPLVSGVISELHTVLRNVHWSERGSVNTAHHIL